MRDLETILFFVGFALGALCVGLLVDNAVTTSFRRQAIERGHAYYSINPTNGVTTWNWK